MVLQSFVSKKRMPYLHRAMRFVTFLLILFLLNNEVETATDLTYLNCPADFQVSAANTSSPSPSRVKLFFTLYDNDIHKSKVQKIVIQGKTEDLNAYISQMMTPYIVVLAAFFIFFMVIACCNIFQKSCPPCESWRRDFARRPYQKFELRCVMIFTVIFAVGIFVVSIVMFTSFPVLKQQMQYTQCSLYTMLDVTKNGDQSRNWGGFAQLKNQIGNISSLLTTTSNEVNSNFKGFDGLSDDDWIIEDMEAMKIINQNIFKNNNDSKLISPNPTITESMPAGTFAYINSYFITDGLGPSTQPGTMVNDIDKGLKDTQVLSNQAYLIAKQALILVDSAVTIKANTDSSLKTLSMYEQQLLSVESQLKEFDNAYFDKLFDWGLYVIEGIIGFILAASVFIIFGTISTHILDILACRTMVNLGWIIYGITYFGVIVLVFAFMSAGSIAFSFCNYFDGMVSSQTQFNRIGQAYSQNAMTKLDVCLYGDGNVLTKFNIAKEMQTVTQVFTNIQTYYDYENPTSVRYINKDFSINKIQGWITAMQKYRNGIYVDSGPSLIGDDDPQIALSKLNQFTKYHFPNGTRDVNCPRDIWAFDSTNCTDPSAQTYQATSLESNGLRFTTVNDLCISFNEKLHTGLSSSWDFINYKKRYQQVIHSCTGGYTNILRYGNTLLNYRDSRENLFQGLKDQLSFLLAKNQQFKTNLGLYKTRVDNFYSSVSTLNNLVTDKISGLLVSSDCRVVSDYLKFTNNVFCKNSIAQITTLGICSIVLLLFMIGGILTASVFSHRYSRVQIIQKHSRRIVIPEGSMNSETFQKKQDDSSSSSSSSDED